MPSSLPPTCHYTRHHRRGEANHTDKNEPRLRRLPFNEALLLHPTSPFLLFFAMNGIQFPRSSGSPQQPSGSIISLVFARRRRGHILLSSTTSVLMKNRFDIKTCKAPRITVRPPCLDTKIAHNMKSTLLRFTDLRMKSAGMRLNHSTRHVLCRK